MDLAQAICDAGVEAVLEGRTIWGAKQDNELREEFISALMARHLHASVGKSIKFERYYTTIYGELAMGKPRAVEIVEGIGGFRADLVIYDGSPESLTPVAIIETKVFAEGASPINIISDLHKGDPVNLSSRISVYGAVLVCETTNQNLEQRKAVLQKDFNGTIVYSAPQKALQDWHWCFACLTSGGASTTLPGKA